VSKRYRENVDVTVAPQDGVGKPARFAWRGSTYAVVSVLGHWREDAGYWSGGGIAVPQRDLWRVEARRVRARANPTPTGGDRYGASARGVYELVCEDDTWRLDRVWD
jgi:hypothetical protein